MEVEFTKEYLEARQEYFDAIDKFFANQDFNNLMGLVPSIYKMFTAKHQEGALAELDKKGFSKEAGDLQSSLRNLLEYYWKQRKNDELVVWYLIKILSNDFRNDQYFKKTQELCITIEKLRSDSISKIYPDKFYDSEVKKEKTSEELKKEDNENIKKFDENYKAYIKKYEEKQSHKKKKTGLIVGLLLLVLVLAGIGAFLFYLFTPAKMDDGDTGIVVEVLPESRWDKVGLYEMRVEEVEEDTQKDHLIQTVLGKEVSRYTAYDITLLKAGKDAQFKGTAKIFFPKPEGINENNAVVYYVSENAQAEEFEAVYSVAENTLTIETTHFSIYVVAEKPYTVAFKNEGEIVSEQKVAWGNYADTPKEEPRREGYTFLGWFVGGVKWDENASIHQDITIEAKWKANEYAVTFDANEGTVGKKDIVVTYGEITVLEAPRREGYEFLGWYEGDKKFESGVWKTARNVTLTAKWRIQEYTVVYELNGGTNNRRNPIWYNVLSGMVTLEDPTREGYTFEGWYEDANYRKRATSILSGSTGDKTFYAKWNAKSYCITYVLDGGENALNNPYEYTVESGVIVLNAPTKKGYIFDGWYEKLSTEKVEYIMIGSTGNKTFYAKWKAETNIIVVFDDNYNISYERINRGTESILNAEYDKKFEDITIPVRIGYDFDGYYEDKNFNNRYVDEFGVCTSPVTTLGELTLYAKWTLKSNYSIISSIDNLYKLSGKAIEGDYLLEKDLDMEGKSWIPIKSFNNGSFYGNGYAIYNFVVTDPVYWEGNKESALSLGLFGNIKSNGRVQDLQVGQNGYPTKIIFDGDEQDTSTKCYKNNVTAGMIAGNCNGTIDNCRVVNCNIATYVWSNNHMSPWNNVGAVCGTTRGTISWCCVSKGSYYSKAMSGYDGNNCDARVGGISGYTGSCSIEHCYVKSVNLKSYAYTRFASIFNYAGNPSAWAGGIAGKIAGEGGKSFLKYCIVNSNVVESKISWCNCSGQNGEPHSGLLIGEEKKEDDCVPIGNIVIESNKNCVECKMDQYIKHSKVCGNNSNWDSSSYTMISSATYPALCNAYDDFKNYMRWEKILDL